MNNTVEIINRGIECLIKGLGEIETEEFISVLSREKFDYTKWQKGLFDDMSLDELNTAAAEYSKHDPLC